MVFNWFKNYSHFGHYWFLDPSNLVGLALHCHEPLELISVVFTTWIEVWLMQINCFYECLKWSHWVETIVIIIGSNHQDKTPAKRRLISVRIPVRACRRLNFGIFHQLQTNGKNTKSRISCLKVFVHDVWICTCLPMDYLRISCLFEEMPGVWKWEFY